MRNGSEQLRLFYRVSLVVCAVVVLLALVALGAGIMAVFSVLTSLCVFIFVPFNQPSPVRAMVRRIHRR
jgi:hypothetical protein